MRKLPEFCIRRPVFSTVLSLIVILIGLFCYYQINVHFSPGHNSRNVMIYVPYPGASQATVESTVVNPLEGVINDIQGIKNIQSFSSIGGASIQLTVADEADYNDVVTNIRDAIAQAQSRFPAQVGNAKVYSNTSLNNNELMDVSFWSDSRDPSAIRNYLQQYLVPQLQQISGVGQLYYDGGTQPIMRIWLDPAKMAALGINSSEVQTAIDNANQLQPAGQINSKTLTYPITADTRLKSATDFNNVIVKNISGNLIHISDIGYAQFASDDRKPSYSALNQQQTLTLEVNYVWGKNSPLDIARSVKTVLQQFQQQLPPDIHMQIIFDQSPWFQSSLDEVYWAIGIAVLLVCLIIVLFLGSLRAALIPIITIPICILGSIALLYVCGLTINVITLLALVLSIGLIVDDSIVIVENVHRHIEQGASPIMAAIRGSTEIVSPIISMSLTLIAVFLPIIFLNNSMALFFKSFAITLSGSVLLSGFIALTLSPTMCARFLVARESESRYEQWMEHTFNKISVGYHTLLKSALQHRLWIVISLGLLIISGAVLLTALPKTYAPSEDIGIVMIFVSPAPGTNITTGKQQAEQIYQAIKDVPGIENIAYFMDFGEDPNYHIYLPLKPYTERSQSSPQIAEEVQQRLRNIPGIQASAIPSTFFSGRYDYGFEFAILTNEDYSVLNKDVDIVVNKLQHYPGLTNVTNQQAFNSQQYQITINSLMAAKLNVNNQDVSNAIAIFLSGQNTLTQYAFNNQLYDIVLQAEPQYQTQISDLDKIYIRNATGQMIPLASVINVERQVSMNSLPHYNLLRAGIVGGQIAPGYSMGQVIDDMKTLLPQILPEGAKYAFVNSTQEYIEANDNVLLLTLAAVLFIYLVLAAQFESFVDPLIILLAVPLSVISALWALQIMHGSLNIFTEIGFITLVGLIAKHGILITQFANQLRAKGLSAYEAVLEGAKMRLRPILMTTGAMVFGALPLVFSNGALAQSRHQLGWVMIVGIGFGTFFSLIVVPIMYTLLSRFKKIS